MRISLLLIILIICSKSFLKSYDKKPSRPMKTISVEFDKNSHTNVFPIDVFNREYDFIITGLFDNPGYKIYWDSWCINGRYYLGITPKQIYLKSGHENPTPNKLYWVSNITDEQYQIIIPFLFKYFYQKNKETGYQFNLSYFFETSNKELYQTRFEKPIDEENDAKINDTEDDILTPDEEAIYEQDCIFKRYLNFEYLIKIVNIPLNEKGLSINYPNLEEFNHLVPIQLLEDEAQVLDWKDYILDHEENIKREETNEK